MARKLDVPFKIRLTEGLKKRLELAAAQSGRSVTAELVARLERSFPAGVRSVIAENRRLEVEAVEADARDLQQRLQTMRQIFEEDGAEMPQDVRTRVLQQMHTLEAEVKDMRRLSNELAHEFDHLTKADQR